MIVTLTTAGLCGLILLILSLRVSAARGKARVSIGDGGDALLLARGRAQANFIEYVPLILILMGLIEGYDGDRRILGILGIVLIVARILHAIGMGRPAPNPARMIGALGTYVALLGLSVWALIISVHLHQIV